MPQSHARLISPLISNQRRLGLMLMASMIFTLFAVAAQAETIIKSHGFSTYGDLKYPADFAHFDYVNPDAPKGGEISIATQGTFDSFNPYTRKGRAGALSTSHYETLLVASKDEPGAYYGLVAESLEYPESQDWVIFNMRPEARFSDGTPVTADDVVFSHHIFLEQGLESYAKAVSLRIPKAEALDTHRVKFYFSPDFPRKALIDQVGGTPVMSKKWFEETGARIDEPRLEPGIGSGPYILDSYDINRRIVYKRRPDYWGADLPVNVGTSNYDRIRIEYFTDSIAAFEAFKAGEVTFRRESSSKSWATSYDFPALSRGDVVKTVLPDGNVPAASGFVFNLSKPQFKDIRVREALQLAYNFEWTNASLQFGLFKQLSSFWEGSDLAAKDVPEGEELALLQSLGDIIAPEILTEPAVMPHTSSESRQADRRNLRRAQGLLDEAGWPVGDDGIRRNAEGKVLRVEFLSDEVTLERIIMPYIDNLKTIGVEAKYSRIDPSQFTKRRRDRDFDMIVESYDNGLEPSTGLYQKFGEEAVEYSVFNPAGISGPDIQALIDKVVQASSREELQVATRALDRVLRSKRFMVPTWYLGAHWVAYFDMYEHPENLPPFDLGYLDLWWINADKAAALKASGTLR